MIGSILLLTTIITTSVYSEETIPDIRYVELDASIFPSLQGLSKDGIHEAFAGLYPKNNMYEEDQLALDSYWQQNLRSRRVGDVENMFELMADMVSEACNRPIPPPGVQCDKKGDIRRTAKESDREFFFGFELGSREMDTMLGNIYWLYPILKDREKRPTWLPKDYPSMSWMNDEDWEKPGEVEFWNDFLEEFSVEDAQLLHNRHWEFLSRVYVLNENLSPSLRYLKLPEQFEGKSTPGEYAVVIASLSLLRLNPNIIAFDDDQLTDLLKGNGLFHNGRYAEPVVQVDWNDNFD